MTQTTTVQPQGQRRPVIRHPVWCDPASCTAMDGHGHHFSRVIELKALPRCPLGVAVRLSQGTAVAGFPLSNVPLVQLSIADDEGELCEVGLYVEMAQELGRLLVRLSPNRRL